MEQRKDAEQQLFDFTDRPVQDWSQGERERVAAHIREKRSKSILLNDIEKRYEAWCETITPEYDDNHHKGI